MYSLDDRVELCHFPLDFIELKKIKFMIIDEYRYYDIKGSLCRCDYHSSSSFHCRTVRFEVKS